MFKVELITTYNNSATLDCKILMKVVEARVVSIADHSSGVYIA